MAGRVFSVFTCRPCYRNLSGGFTTEESSCEMNNLFVAQGSAEIIVAAEQWPENLS